MENFIFVQHEFFTWEEWPSGLKYYIILLYSELEGFCFKSY